MRTGRSKKPIRLAEEQHSQFDAIAYSRSLPHGIVVRSHLVLLAAEGLSISDIIERLDLNRTSVGKWGRRIQDSGIQGLHDALRLGRPRTVADEKVAQLARKTLDTKPTGGTMSPSLTRATATSW